MAKKFEWQERERGGVRLRTDTLTLYVEPADGGFVYRVGGHYQLRFSLKPIPTLAEAKAKCLKAALGALRGEIDALAAVKDAPGVTTQEGR